MPSFPPQPGAPRLWQSHPRELAAAALLLATGGIALFGAGVGVGDATPGLPAPAAASHSPTLSAPDPAMVVPASLQDLAPGQALAINGQLPIATGPNPPAAPFQFKGRNPADLDRAIECLSSAIYYEAGRESENGQRAVAQVVLNRVRHPAYPNNVCAVVYEGSTRPTGCQFTFTCDGSLAYRPIDSVWKRTRRIAVEALSGHVYAPVGQATHYHANYVVPTWASSLAKVAIEGAHIFYRWAGNWGRPAAFTDAYAGRESSPDALRRAALAVPHPLPDAATPQTDEDLPPGVSVADSGKDRKVIAKFRPEARKAADAAVVIPYVEREKASDNLRYALDGDSSVSDQPAFGSLDSNAQGRQSPGS